MRAHSSPRPLDLTPHHRSPHPFCRSWLSCSSVHSSQRYGLSRALRRQDRTGRQARRLVGSGSGAWHRGASLHSLPRQTVHEVFPHTAFRQRSPDSVRGRNASWPQGRVSAGELVTFLVGVIGSDEHAPSHLSPLDAVEAGDLPSDAVVLSASSSVLCPPPTSHGAPAWISQHVLIPRLPRGVNPRPREISLVALMALSTFRAPYAGGFFEAAHPESSPLPWPSRQMKRSAPSCSPCGA